MEGIQLENGYTRIANAILEALAKWKFSDYEMRIIWVILRKTYGFHKKDDWISLSQFVKATGIQRPHVCRSLRLLINQRIVTKGGTKYCPLYRFHKDYKDWCVLPKGARSHHITKGGTKVLPKGAIGVVPKGAHTKETITKENTIVSSKADTSPNMKLLNENQHSDEWETVLDIDTGKPVQKILKEVDPNVASAMWQMITWAVKEKRQNILFPNLGKQFKALKILRLMGIQPCQIQERWAELQEDSFYQKAGIDFMSLVKSFERKI